MRVNKNIFKASVTMLATLVAVSSLGAKGLDPQRNSSKNDQKPVRYGDWDVVYDKVLKKTTLQHQHRPYGEPVPGMGDAFTRDTFQLEYSFEAIFVGKPGTEGCKKSYWLVFDNPLMKNATLALANENRFFKYSPETQFTLLTDGDTWTSPVKSYHTGEFGDAIIGHHPYEEFRIQISEDLLYKMETAKEVAGNLSSDDQNASKSFTFDEVLKDVLVAFIYRVNEIEEKE